MHPLIIWTLGEFNWFTNRQREKIGSTMVLILDGNVEIATQIWSETGNLICLRRLLDRE